MHTQLEALFKLIDETNSADPVQETEAGAEVPRALLYGQRMSRCLDALYPDAPAELRAAARAQHIGRWQIPRGDYPQDRSGYLKWRRDLIPHHVRLTTDLMRRLTIAEDSITRVEQLLSRRNLKTDSDVQTLEDVACLVFLQYYFEDLCARLDDEKIIGIVAKTWRKMSPRGHEAALALEYSPAQKRLLDSALAAG